jgi:TonB-linked SusC/RagA family outer membrane protein
LKVGVQINGRIEARDNPGVPGVDDYWAPRFALLRNRPYERPFANDNPEYLNDIGHNSENWGLLNKDKSGYWTQNWRVLQTNFNAEYKIPGVDGLTAVGKYSYYMADNKTDGHEYTYDAYTYHPDTDTYERTGGSSNPWRERINEKVFNEVLQGQLHYNKTFGQHTIGATYVYERIEKQRLFTFQHGSPSNNFLPNLSFAELDALGYADLDEQEARIGYVGRISYGFADRYYLEISGRRDGSWKFPPDKRWGFFPSASIGWRVTEEQFFKNLVGENVLSDLKLRASHGKTGDDNVNNLGPFDYVPGYNYNSGGAGRSIFDGQVELGSRDKGVPITNISWFTSVMTDVGADFSLLNGKLSGTVDYFYRKRTGLRGPKYDVIVPAELGYSLPDENVNSDAVVGWEGLLSYNGTVGDVTYSIGGNLSFARNKFLSSYKPRFGNSWENYRFSAEDRWSNIMWGYEALGQFRSAEEISDYPVNIDGQGNRTLLPGDIIYKDQNGDGKIDGFDERPIGYAPDRNPIVNFGINLSVQYKRFDFTADFSGGSMYTFMRRWEMLWPYQNGGNLLRDFYDNRWHREDPFDVNSEWNPGKYPALRFNEGGHSNYRDGQNNTFWSTNVTYLRARTIELGYSVPADILSKVKMQRARVYVNTYNLFSIDNMKDIGIDPEILDPNGLQYPPNKFVNVGVNLSF